MSFSESPSTALGISAYCCLMLDVLVMLSVTQFQTAASSVGRSRFAGYWHREFNLAVSSNALIEQ
jgi:hypothetical protein